MEIRTGFKSTLFSLIYYLSVQSTYRLGLLFSLGAGVVSALNMLLNGLEKGVTPYGVDAITYYATSTMVLVFTAVYNFIPEDFTISMNSSLDGTLLGGISSMILMRLIFTAVPLTIFFLFGAKISLKHPELLIIVFLLSVLLSMVASYVDMTLPGSNILLYAYNGVTSFIAGVWFSPSTTGIFLILFKVFPQYWIGEAIRLSLMNRSLEPPFMIYSVLATYTFITLVMIPIVKRWVMRRGIYL